MESIIIKFKLILNMGKCHNQHNPYEKFGETYFATALGNVSVECMFEAKTDIISIENFYNFTIQDILNFLANIYKERTPVIDGESANERIIRIISTHELRSPSDSLLADQLKKIFKITIDRIKEYKEYEELGNNIQWLLTFDHCWALWAWSHWLRKQPCMRKPLLIHLDYHNDLSSPSILTTKSRGTYRSPIGNDFLILQDPTSVERFINRGFIGIGSFIAPLLWSLNGFNIIHLVAPNNEEPWKREKRLIIHAEQQTGLFLRQGRQPVVDIENKALGGKPFYKLTNDHKILRQLSYPGPVFLDVDLDFFCNYFDTNLDKFKLSISENLISKLMDETLESISKSPLLPYVEVVTIAFSPDFFPSSLWELALNWLARLKKVLINQ